MRTYHENGPKNPLIQPETALSKICEFMRNGTDFLLTSQLVAKRKFISWDIHESISFFYEIQNHHITHHMVKLNF